MMLGTPSSRDAWIQRPWAPAQQPAAPADGVRAAHVIASGGGRAGGCSHVITSACVAPFAGIHLVDVRTRAPTGNQFARHLAPDRPARPDRLIGGLGRLHGRSGPGDG